MFVGGPLSGALQGASTRPRHPLIERDADTLFLSPYNVARHVPPLGIKYQSEMFRDQVGAGDVKRRPGIRHVANHASDRAAAELYRSGF